MKNFNKVIILYSSPHSLKKWNKLYKKNDRSATLNS